MSSPLTSFDLAGRLALVDELDAALEVEAELGRLVGDDQRRDDDQPEHEEQDEEVAAPVAHRSQPSGVRTSSSPPSSS